MKLSFSVNLVSKLKKKTNRPNILTNDYKKAWLLIDMSVPTDNNISVKEYNEISKYKDLEMETEKNVAH